MSPIATRTFGARTSSTYADFFDVENHPTIAFAGRFTERVGGSHFKAEVELTIRGIPRPVIIDVAYLGQWEKPEAP